MNAPITIAIFFVLGLCSASGTLVTLNQAQELSRNFTIWGGMNNLSFSSSAGVGDSGGIAVLPSDYTDSATFTSEPLAPYGSGTTLSISLLWQFDASLVNPFVSSANALSLGFSPDSISPGWVPVSVTFTRLQNDPNFTVWLRALDSSHSYYSIPAQFISGHWYKTSLTVNIVGGSFGQVDLSTTTADLGPSGIDDPVPVAGLKLEQSFSSFQTAGAHRLYGAFSAMSAGGTRALDNLETVGPKEIPEPTSFGLLGLGSLILLGARLRRNSRALTA